MTGDAPTRPPIPNLVADNPQALQRGMSVFTTFTVSAATRGMAAAEWGLRSATASKSTAARQ